MDENTIREIQQWLTKAQRDLGSARRLLEGNPPYRDTAVYHCQQAAEKALKAYLTYRETAFLKTHDLRVLLDQCIELDAEFNELSDVPDVLNPYSIGFRYPGDFMEPEQTDVDEAIKLAERAINFVGGKIPTEFVKPSSDS